MKVIVGAKYKHFKGHIYEVISLAKSADDLTCYVVYKNVSNGDVWIRKYDEFISNVDKNKYPDIIQEKRFELIND